MTRKLLPLALLLALPAFARSRSVSTDLHPELKPSGATVSGIVTSVNGNNIQIAGGLVTIDATGAKIVIDRGKEATVAQIQPGMLLFATLKSNDVGANAALPADTITATHIPATTLFGPVQSVDVASNSFKLLGRTINVNSDTSFGGVHSLSELLPNQFVQVLADVSGGRLVASSVLVISNFPPSVQAARGTVKSITADSWVISRERDSDLTLVVNAQTKIAGSPKVGDTVEVVYSIDSAHANVAISIIKVEVKPPAQTTILHGRVKTIESTAWTLTLSSNEEVRVLVDSRTKMLPGIKAGDTVEVIAQKNDAGVWVALVIVRLP